MKTLIIFVLLLFNLFANAQEPHLRFVRYNPRDFSSAINLDPKLFQHIYNIEAKGISDGIYELYIGRPYVSLNKLGEFTAKGDGKLYPINKEQVSINLVDLMGLAPGEVFVAQLYKKGIPSKEPSYEAEITPTPIRAVSNEEQLAITIKQMDEDRKLFALNFEQFPRNKPITLEVKYADKSDQYNFPSLPDEQVLIPIQNSEAKGGKARITVFHADLKSPLFVEFEWGQNESYQRLMEKFSDFFNSEAAKEEKNA